MRKEREREEGAREIAIGGVGGVERDEEVRENMEWERRKRERERVNRRKSTSIKCFIMSPLYSSIRYTVVMQCFFLLFHFTRKASVLSYFYSVHACITNVLDVHIVWTTKHL